MGVDLLKHNREAFQEINKMIESGIKKIAAPRATGSGKTYLMGALAEQYNNDKKLVLEPTRPLLDSIKEKFDEFGVSNTDFITYQKLIRMRDEDIAAMDYKLIFLDECHHGTAPVWGMKLDFLMSTHSDSIIFGTSATTVRNDGVDVVEALFDNNAIGELPLSVAIARKVLPCPHYITAVYRLDDEFEKLKKKVESSTNTKFEKKKFYKKMQTMKLHFEKSYGVPLILNKYIKVRNGKYLVFCKDKKHLDSMHDVVIDWFKMAGIKNVHSYAVYSDYPDKEKDYKDFCDDKSDALKILFSINILNEGLHIKDISGVLMLRTTQSNLIYLQQLGRLVEAENLDKYLVVFDFVNNFSSVNDGIGLLKEIKDAIVKEKKSNPNFEDSGFEDIDTYFVIDQIVEIQEMFREIEGRLQDDWDTMFQEYCKFYEENGHGDVPKTEEYRKLSNWCAQNRIYKIQNNLSEDKIKLLDNYNFIWKLKQYKFERHVIDLKKFVLSNGCYPKQTSKSEYEVKLANFVINERANKRRAENSTMDYPQWKINIIEKEHLYDFFDEKESSFDRFYRMALVYKKRYGHTDIKYSDVIDGYNIGAIQHSLNRLYKRGKLKNVEIEKLWDIGIDITKMKFEKRYDMIMQLAKQAIMEGVIISNKNRFYQNVNLYNWYITHKKNFSYEEWKVFNQLMSLHNIPVMIVDVLNNLYKKYNSVNEAGRALYLEFNIVKNDKSGMWLIRKYLNKRITTPYKGRFMFYYVTDEEVKKYFEDNKMS